MPESVTKAELADVLFERLGLNKREAKDMVDYFFEEVREALEAGQFAQFRAQFKADRARGV